VTFQEALSDRNVERIRLPEWHLGAYLELPPRFDNGTHGPWVILHDSSCGAPTPMMVFEFRNDRETRYVKADPPLSSPLVTREENETP
jgi:hypothetical protein